MLVRLLYASQSAQPLTHDVVESILAQSRSHNPERGITGILCFGDDIFMQVLEGSRDQVSALFSEICRDPRHQRVTLMHFAEISEREFSGWTMGQVNMDKINPCLLLKYSETPDLNPFANSGQASLSLLRELMATASIVGRTSEIGNGDVPNEWGCMALTCAPNVDCS
jgi:hypothetical protein